MKKHLPIGAISILKMFALLYPLCPGYFYIAQVPVRELLLVLTVSLLFLFTKGTVFLKIKKFRPRFYEIVIWSLILFCLQVYHAEWMLALTQIFLWIGMVYFGSSVINTKEKFIAVIDTIITGSIIVGVFGLVEEFFHFNIFSLLNTAGTELNYNPIRLGIFRIISFTSHAISYGCYCMIVFILILYRLSIEKKRFLYIAGALMLINEFLTLSRVTLIGLFAEIILILWFSGFQRFIKKTFQGILLLLVVIIVLYNISETMRSVFKLASYVVLALFDDSYVSVLARFGFTDNARGIGNRIDLYKWVYEEIKDNIILGKGAYNVFEHRFINTAGYWQTKNSIEVQWLRTLYRYGIIGVISELYMYIMLLIHTLSPQIRIPSEWEGRLSFPRNIAAMLIAYMIVLSGVMQNQEFQLFSLVIMLLIAYVKRNGFARKKIK